MIKTAKLVLFLGICCISSVIFAQNNQQTNNQGQKEEVKKEQEDKQMSKKSTKGQQHFFANIFSGAYHSFNTKQPNSGFELSTALLGYSYKIKDKIKCTLIYDVTRTTNGFEVKDTDNNILPVSYFEGSKYTAFLKMAEIKWQINPHFYLSSGQLLKQQYLTVQDKVWNHRYVMVSMQEMQRFGAPADFGMRLGYQHSPRFNASLTAINGNGPFRHQEQEGILEYTANVEYYPVEHLLLKTYVSLTETSNGLKKKNKSTFSGFIAYKKKRYTIGVEYAYLKNPSYDISSYSGLSAFAWYKINAQFEVFGRYDYIEKSTFVEQGQMYNVGVQYQPESHLFMSLNLRAWSKTEVCQMYFNVGAKF